MTDPKEPSPTEQAVEIAACAADSAYFIHNFCVLDDTQGHGGGGGSMPFRLWPAQVPVAYDLAHERRVIILKARQMGISWLCCGDMLHHCHFSPGRQGLMFSQGQMEANELLRRVGVMYERLPGWMQAINPIVKRNTEQIVWANESRVRSLPATQRAGRSLTASKMVMDEAAHCQWASGLYVAAKPTVDAGGQLVVLSTANGEGNFFHRQWTQAEQGLNGFKPVFMPWWSRPGRDLAWYDRQVAEAEDPALIPQEYPATAREAFLSTGRKRFAAEWLEAQEPGLATPVPMMDLPPPLRIAGLSVYGRPAPEGRRRTEVVIGADVAEGLEHRDRDAAAVLNPATWEELACLHGHWEPDEYARHLHTLAEAYDATVVVERNNHGHAVLLKLRELCPDRVADGPDGRPGWFTSAVTKPQSIDALAVALRDRACTVRSAGALAEMRLYSVLRGGATGAPQGYHDDLVMAWAVAIGWKTLCGAAGSWTTGPGPTDDYRG